MKYVIFEMINANLIDFSLVEETSLETLRLSLDTTKCILKFQGKTPAFFSRFATIQPRRNIANNKQFWLV